MLLGSSARRLKTANTNLLAGRATTQTMYPFVPAELGKDFDLERVLRLGSIPLVWQAADSRATLEAYVQFYIREEIRAEALVRNLPGFLRFLPVAALFHGQVINISGLARDAATARTTVEGYIDILQDTLLATTLPGFEARLRGCRERQHPKLYWVDSGVVRAAKRQLGAVAAEERGALLEGWILTVLRAHNAESNLSEDISYWAPAQARHTEVDFLLRRGSGSRCARSQTSDEILDAPTGRSARHRRPRAPRAAHSHLPRRPAAEDGGWNRGLAAWGLSGSDRRRNAVALIQAEAINQSTAVTRYAESPVPEAGNGGPPYIYPSRRNVSSPRAILGILSPTRSFRDVGETARSSSSTTISRAVAALDFTGWVHGRRPSDRVFDARPVCVEVQINDRNPLGLNVLPDIELGPVEQRVDAHVGPRTDIRLVLFPEFRRLIGHLPRAFRSAR